jgi:hypothetical protein
VSPLLVMILWLLPTAMAARLELAVDSGELAIGQTVALQVQLIDGVGRGMPELANQDGVSLRYQGQSQSTVVVNFKTTRIVRYTYAMTAVKEGTWTVGPARLKVGGKTLESPAIQIDVEARPVETADASGVTTELSDDAPYLGQVVVLEAKYKRTQQVLDARWSFPDMDGFRQDTTAEATRREYSTTIDGEQAVVEEVHIPLIAVGEGRRAIGRASVTAQLPTRRPVQSRRDFFFDRTELRTETWTSEPHEIVIRPLPEAGRPDDYSGLVGHFDARVRSSARSVALGETLTIEVRITGDGTLAGFKLPPLPEDSGLRAYDDAPELTAAMNDGEYRSVAVFRRAVVAEREGQLEIPALRIPVFDPSAEAWVNLETRALTIKVTPGEGDADLTSFSGGEADQRKDVEALGDDILPAPGDADISDHTLHATLPYALGLPLLPALGLVMLGISGMAGRKRGHGPSPQQQLRERLSRLPSDPAARLQALEDAFREAAALQLGLPAPGLDRAAVAPLGDEAHALYGALEAARYGGHNTADLEARVRRFVDEALQ